MSEKKKKNTAPDTNPEEDMNLKAEAEDTMPEDNPAPGEEEAAASPDDSAGEDGAVEIEIEDGDESPDDEDAADSETEKGKKDEKDGFFGRRHKKELAKKEEELAALKDRYMRTLAEYENYRKRTEKEKSDIYAFAVRDVMTKMLPILDNLERGLSLIPEESRKEPVAEGMDKICKQFIKTLDDLGVKPIEAVGQPFDPNLHNAVMHVDDENLGESVVAEEFQKGYTYKDGVIRHSMVKVAN